MRLTKDSENQADLIFLSIGGIGTKTAFMCQMRHAQTTTNPVIREKYG